ncbi:ABC transporter substrate-binding protein [Desmospora profundinema]|uniref:Iron complex transport system substrate-binding protein n=1 Tax=Desmospora profundinema TaxID=1571184 RepID=A0ABU1INF3_9BACL|nr:ABC transporter substrate-binding protein [Desmospora profundinema]MDR6226072.1 iron complex transport system substrate-binding protein [Desmospora profundinema]
MKRWWMWGLSLLFPIMMVTGCGSASEAEREEGKGREEALAIEDFSGETLTFDAPPKRIVTLTTGDTEMIYALGGEVVGRPATNGPVVPTEAEAAEEVGHAHEVNLEKLASLDPDVVVGHARLNQKDRQAIEEMGIPVLMTQADSLKDLQRSAEMFGELLGKTGEAEKLVADLGKLEERSEDNGVKALLVYGAPGAYLAALPSSLNGEILRLAGGDNLAEDDPELKEYPQYAQLDMERVVKADPEVIYLITHGDPEKVKAGFKQEMKKNPAWNRLSAVKDDNVVILPPHLFGSNPGPRLQDAVEWMKKSLDEVKKSRG